MVSSIVAKATRKSIKKHMPLGVVMSGGSSNPLTIHECDDELFRAIWCLLGETMIAGGELERIEKEEIATMVSRNNSCSVCVTAHVMMATAARKKFRASKDKSCASSNVVGTISEQEERARQILDYAELVQRASQDDVELTIDDLQHDFSLLTDKSMAEAALVVMLKQHMNRITGALCGEQMMTATMGVPRSVAVQMEKPGVLKVMNKMMKPIMSSAMNKEVQPGFTEALFKGNTKEDATWYKQKLPDNLQRVEETAGPTAAKVVARLCCLVDELHPKISPVVSEQVLSLVDKETKLGADGERISPVMIVHWIEEKLGDLTSEEDKAVATVLLLVSFFPKRVFNSKQWTAFVEAAGNDLKLARLVVLWYSLRLTLKQAKGFELTRFRAKEDGLSVTN